MAHPFAVEPKTEKARSSFSRILAKEGEGKKQEVLQLDDVYGVPQVEEEEEYMEFDDETGQVTSRKKSSITEGDGKNLKNKVKSLFKMAVTNS